jgi:alkanesulfonate monooxygenase SsuD/methylene tetrahydromethanopterin reductase-like flavin-dependent oxidoreductase (luciferase family)
MGTGWMREEHEAYGFPFLTQGERTAQLEEQLQVVIGQWEQAPFDHSGERYTLQNLDARPKPVQQPRPHLLLGGRGGPRSVALGARYADEYNTVHKTVDEIAEIRRGLDAACEREGRERMPLSQMASVLIGADQAELRDRAAQLAEWRGVEGGADELLAGLPDHWIVGTLDEAAEQLAALEAAGLERVMLQHLLHRDLDALALFAKLAS